LPFADATAFLAMLEPLVEMARSRAHQLIGRKLPPA